MELNSKTKVELLAKCAELGITKCSAKNKSQLIELINAIPVENAFVAEPDIPVPVDGIKKHLKPLIKWSGGKSDEIKQFEKYIPSDYDTYIEPFIGGGALYFHLMPLKSVISDVHVELVDLYKSIGEGKAGEIYNFMDINPKWPHKKCKSALLQLDIFRSICRNYWGTIAIALNNKVCPDMVREIMGYI